MFCVKQINIDEFDYPLPDERIARYPLAQRDASKLLVSRGETIEEAHFSDLCRFLPEHSLLVLNETKVVRARLLFHKDSGAQVEIFCLDPVSGNGDYQVAFGQRGSVEWRCLVGNSRRWKDEKLVIRLCCEVGEIELSAERLEKNDEHSVVRLSWTPSALSFAEVLERMGEVPLPPYLHREAEVSDRERYQAVFAHYDGSVAAPTASLHFTEKLLRDVETEGHSFAKVTLHVGAGTFRPVSSATIGEHQMHSEAIILRRDVIEELKKAKKEGREIIPVGTTAMRTLESLYWLGVEIRRDGFQRRELHVEQWIPYETATLPTPEESLGEVLKYMSVNNIETLQATTALIIAPSCKIQMATGLITNFHQPKSTLLLLVSALIGERWKKCYQYALDHDFRFLSYGDSCFFRK